MPICVLTVPCYIVVQHLSHREEIMSISPDTYKPMDAHALDHICQAIFFTKNWQGPLSRMLDMDRTTVNRWATGKQAVPKYIHLLLVAMRRFSIVHGELPAMFSPGYITDVRDAARKPHNPDEMWWFGMTLPTVQPQGVRKPKDAA
jgi:hypothetical protein